MKMTRITSVVLAGLLAVSAAVFTSPVTLADDDSVSAPYAVDFCRGIADSKAVGTVDLSATVDGKKVVKITPDPTGADAETMNIVLDAYGIDNKKFDLDTYRYATVEYKYDTQSPSYDGAMIMRVLPSQMGMSGDARLTSVNTVKAGEWSSCTFDLAPAIEKLTAGESHILWQFHFMPFGDAKASKLTRDDVLYIGNFTFSAEAPEGVEVKETLVTRPPVSAVGSAGAVSASSYTAPEGSASFAYADNICRGITDRKDVGTAEVGFDYNGKKTVKLTPNPEGADASSNYINLDAYDVASKNFDLDKYKYVVIEYKYDTKEPSYEGEMQLNLLKNKVGLTSTLSFKSNEKVEPGDWNVCTFNIGSLVANSLVDGESHILWQFHFMPFGSAKANKLTSDDVIYIGNITFTEENPFPDRKYAVEFSGGGATEGTAPETLYLSEGETFTLPPCTYELGSAVFQGWVNSNKADSLYQPGTEITVSDGNLIFFPKWSMKGDSREVLSLDYPSYYNGIIDKNLRYFDISLADESVTVDGLTAIMAQPNPKAETGKYFGFDGWSFSGAGIDTTKYNYAAILYKFDTAREHKDFHTQLRVLKGGYNKSLYLTSDDELKYGKWDIITYDMTKYAEFIDPSSPIINHIHVLPFEEGKILELDEGDTFYLSKIMFFEKKPDNVTAHSSFIGGYGDGTFRPSNTMTKAEACTIVTRLLTSEAAVKGQFTSSFADVLPGSWYYDNIAYLESLGLLSAYSGNFGPDDNITRAEFVELIYNIGLLSGGDSTRTFTDVDASHPRYNVIMAAAKSGLVGGYKNADGVTYSFQPDATITRAEVVKVINNAYGKKLYKNEYIAKFDAAPLFSDVGLDHWAYIDITEAAIPHGTYESSEEGEEWFYMSTPNVPVDYESGIVKLAEVEELSAVRKAEILATPDKLAETVTGTKYYVSENGDDANDGLSPEKPWKTLGKVSSAKLSKGDGVFFERGSIFRGNLATKSGVSYGAYGEGAKPMLTRSPENGASEDSWTLVDGTTNVWKFYKPIQDVGSVVVDKGEGEFIMERANISYNTSDKKYYLNGNAALPFDHRTDLENYTVAHEFTSADTAATAPLYMRCDDGNPGKVFKSVEFIVGGGHVISAVSAVTIDNLCIKYGARHGIGAGTVSDLIITNCEIGWIGGGSQNITNNGGMLTPGRYGNGIEVYGGCDNYVIDNCYVYQCFDAGITNQYQKGGADSIIEKDVTFSNNLIEYCCYNIEYFMGVADVAATRLLQNVLYENNILRMAGYGWGRVNPTNSADIKGWDHYNMADGFVIRNNIFDRAYGDLLHIGVQQYGWFPRFSGNTYIQYNGGNLGHIGQNATSLMKYDASVSSTVTNTLNEMDAGIFFLKKPE